VVVVGGLTLGSVGGGATARFPLSMYGVHPHNHEEKNTEACLLNFYEYKNKYHKRLSFLTGQS